MKSKKCEEIFRGPIIERYQLEDRVSDFVMEVLQAGFEVRKANGYDDVFLIQKEAESTGTYLCANIQRRGRIIKYKGLEIPNFTLEIDSSPFDGELRKIAKPYTIVRMQ